MSSEFHCLSDSGLGSALVRQSFLDMSEDWCVEPGDISSNALSKELIDLAKADKRGRYYLEKVILEHSLIGADGIFSTPMAAAKSDGTERISPQSMAGWLAQPMEMIGPTLTRIGAGVVAPLLRDQIERQAVVFWRDLLGDSLYTDTLSRRRDVSLLDLKKDHHGGALGRVIELSQRSSDLTNNLTLIGQCLVYTGAQEVWSYLHRHMPDLRERMMLLIPPSLFQKRYKPQLSDVQLEEMLLSAMSDAANYQSHSESEHADKPSLSNLVK
ncbi:hypothetical protein BTA51_05120 [Hahella sp. CCB-MM4]|uniref:hypothetical protein n=1 Tax=Hahella sp. (strain CCB-MM4) TaxID=1926491 RepID=UPI000B9BEA2A|nr:hypothetical protein [Hahella sp. CCB-MM4]OZG74393.1 hypothetical protein BTA51_05120 [Hahella sp. CCB-MM4]